MKPWEKYKTKNTELPVAGATPVDAASIPSDIARLPMGGNSTLTIPRESIQEETKTVKPWEKYANTKPGLKDVPGNALKDIEAMGRESIGLIKPGAEFVAKRLGNPALEQSKAAIQSGIDMATGKDFSETPVGKELSTAGDAVGSTVKAIPQELEDFFSKQAWIEHPINNAMNILAAAGLAGTAMEALAPKAGFITKKGVSSVLGPSEEAISRRLSEPLPSSGKTGTPAYTPGPTEIRGAKSNQGLVEDISGGMSDVQKSLKAEDKKAWETLRESNDPSQGAIPKQSLLAMIRGLKGEVGITGGGVVGDAAQRAISVLDKLATNVRGLGKRVKGDIFTADNPDTPFVAGQRTLFGKSIPKSDYISEKSVRELIQTMDDNIDWKDPLASKTNEVLRNFRQSLDARLKDQNKAYETVMGPVAEKTRLLQDLQDSLRIEPSREGFTPKDTAENIIKSIGMDKRSNTQEILGRLGSEVGRDFPEEAKTTRLASEFDAGKKKKIVGIFDMEGGKIAAKLIDFYLEWKPEFLGKYAKALSEAKLQGPETYTATRLILQQHDPEFRKTIEDVWNRFKGRKSQVQEGFVPIR